MAYQNGFLIRTSLADTGVLGKRQFSYGSPDIICRSQVGDPTTYFTDNYNKDVNQAVNKNSHINYVYGRAKTIDTSSTRKNGYLWIYRSSGSLFMHPELWKNNPLYTAYGQKCVPYTSDKNGEILVTQTPFILDGLQNQYFCMVVIMTDTPEECVPDSFANYDAFNFWVRTNQGVAIRNFNVVSGSTVYEFQRLDYLSNPKDAETLGCLVVSYSHVPIGSKIGMKCDILSDINKYNITTAEEGTLTSATMIPAGFEGYIETYIDLPTGTQCMPEKAEIEIAYYTTVLQNQLCYQYGIDIQTCGFELDDGFIQKAAGAKLILTGSCGTKFE